MALVVIVAGVLVLTTPLWMHLALPASGGSLGGVVADQSLRVSDETVNQLLFGPGDFNVTVTCPSHVFCPNEANTRPVYTDAERAHLRDARLLLYLFVGLAIASLILVMAVLVHRPKVARRWRAVARGGAGLAVGAVVVGVVGYFAFDALFTLFHEVFFPQGNWEFPPDSNMIRLYPYAFWQLTAAALGILCVIFGSVVWWVARRRERSLT